ncbi:VOC family protein [Algoriphagus marinus]|uniref:VOC family protein n=1 Tax=Algoriphagus marinus TaxID=1925762 RepID=UPI00094BBBC8|nr:VOC family protein [Algoriphagus marinus]
MNQVQINGIQQVGIGVSNAEEAWAWYRKAFKFDVPIFQDSAEAKLMTRYTSNKVESRHAILAMNMQGGGGFEIWQYTSKTPLASKEKLKWTDLGILAVKIRSKDIYKTYDHLNTFGATILGKPEPNPVGVKHFFIKDPDGNIFEIIENDSWCFKNKDLTGGVLGVVMGVSSIEKVLPIYQQHFQQVEILADEKKNWVDFNQVDNEKTEFRRVILQASKKATGAFGKLLCQTQIELIETDYPSRNVIFKDRNWGDLGFIHVCFDVNGMHELKRNLKEIGVEFTVDSENEFDMGKAAGRFAYIEDPDGTLIEMVETYKIPIIEKIGWNLNLRNRNPQSTLPDLVLKALTLNRVKD